MQISLAYGRGTLDVELPDDRTTVIEPTHAPGLADERGALFATLDAPVESPPLRQLAVAGKRVTIVHTDITRPMPNDRLIPWLLEYLEKAGVRREDITLLNALGTHRPNTREELEMMLTAEVVARYRCVNHEPHNDDACVAFGTTRTGVPALINRHLVEADVRIITGFIEPHFFAGFSGGPKGIMPGVAALKTVQSNHGVHNIGDRRATFGMTVGNPIWEDMRDIALRIGPSFLVNVTLNRERAITGIFAGDLIAAHRAGTEFVRASAMQKVPGLFDVVITTNSGYPLDMNLYQSGKGMRAAELIVRDGGLIIMAAECREGIPAGSPHDQLIRSVPNGEALLAKLAEPGFSFAEQWAGQIQALIQRRAEVQLHSSLDDDTVRAAHLIPCPHIAEAVRARLRPDTRIAVLPQGPLTIPYVARDGVHA
ncbi:MAG: nickel-dependent lactate racemase [Chthoniobacter sp.]|uniref:nickel-dependent lactate racemase n=1 Tax=Chthoniobacter sp. TaxID=2510640 RepID=UPI0032AD0C42